MSEKFLSQFEKDFLSVSNIYANKFEIERDDAWYLAKLTEELGELVAADLRCANQARPSGRSKEDLREDLANEAADLFAHLLLFCHNRGIELEQAVNRKWLKYLPSSNS